MIRICLGLHSAWILVKWFYEDLGNLLKIFDGPLATPLPSIKKLITYLNWRITWKILPSIFQQKSSISTMMHRMCTYVMISSTPFIANCSFTFSNSFPKSNKKVLNRINYFQLKPSVIVWLLWWMTQFSVSNLV